MIVSEAEAALKALRLDRRAAERELEALLDGEADANDTFLEINAGAGGTESLRLGRDAGSACIVRWAEKKGYEVEIAVRGGRATEAGTKSVAYKISGPNAYGWLKSESGRAPPRADLALRQQGQTRETSFSPRSGSIRWSTTTSTSR